MDFNIIADSCCDLPENLQKLNDVSIVPLSIEMDETLFIDDEALNIDNFLQKMKKSIKITSGAPSAGSYLEKLKNNTSNFIVTLSSKLSGSFSSASVAKDLAEEDNYDVHVFDSLSASAGQMLVVLKLKELIASGLEKTQIISKTENFIHNMKTYYVAQDLSNFIKSGRLGKVKGKIITALGIRPILGAKNGELVFCTNARSDNQTVSKLIELIKNSNKKTTEDIIITHCNNADLTDKLREKIEKTFSFKRIIIAQTRGLSSMYANDKGLIMAF